MSEKGLDAYNNGDYATAMSEWLELAEEGNAQACHNIAFLYLHGQGVTQDFIQAQSWCVKAAELGSITAKTHLGFMFAEQGLLETAVKWWQQAAQNGDADAQNQLGLAYHGGLGGLAQDDENAADWFEEAAMQNHAEAQYNLGVLYANGKRYFHARHWWQKAADQNYADAQAALQKLDQLEQAA